MSKYFSCFKCKNKKKSHGLMIFKEKINFKNKNPEKCNKSIMR